MQSIQAVPTLSYCSLMMELRLHCMMSAGLPTSSDWTRLNRTFWLLPQRRLRRSAKISLSDWRTTWHCRLPSLCAVEDWHYSFVCSGLHCGWKHVSRIENWINPFWHCDEILRTVFQCTDGFHSWIPICCADVWNCFEHTFIRFLLERVPAEVLMIVLIIFGRDCWQNCHNQGTVLDSMVIALPLLRCTTCCLHWLKAPGLARCFPAKDFDRVIAFWGWLHQWLSIVC